MAYDKINWESESTALSAENFNHMEEGIADAHELLAGIFDAIYPVGSIYMSVDLDTPAKVIEKFGGTWVAWGSGKVPVGVDTNDTDFDTVEESGGAKTVTLTVNQIPSHNHTYNKANANTGSHTLTVNEMPAHSHNLSEGCYYSTSEGARSIAAGTAGYIGKLGATDSKGGGQGHTHTMGTASADSGSKGGGQSHTNLQPYITCFMYKRVA